MSLRNKLTKTLIKLSLIVTALIFSTGLLLGCGEYLNISYNENINKNENVSQNISSGKLKVNFIDVGQADSILIQQGKHFMLIDAGNNANKDTVVDYLKAQNVKKLDYVIGTHPHEDHIGGLDTVIDNFNVQNILMPKVITTTKTYRDVIKSIKNNNLKITTPIFGTSYNLGDAKWTILAPNESKYKDMNNYSIVIKLEFGDNSFMFTGDAESLSEKQILNRNYNLKADVLKVGHHGSSSSTCKEFLNAVNPEYAVISVGKDNDYGHPHKTTISKLKAKGIKVYRTDECGNIICTSDGNNIKFEK